MIGDNWFFIYATLHTCSMIPYLHLSSRMVHPRHLVVVARSEGKGLQYIVHLLECKVHCSFLINK